MAVAAFGPAYLEVGASGVAFDNEATNEWQDGFGTDFACTGWGNYLQAEFAYGRQFTAGADPQSGFYVQDALLPSSTGLWGVSASTTSIRRAGRAVNGQLRRARLAAAALAVPEGRLPVRQPIQRRPEPRLHGRRGGCSSEPAVPRRASPAR